MMAFFIIAFSFSMLRVTEVTSPDHPCRTVEPISGFCLRGQSYKTYDTVTLERCILLCEQETGCFSINYFKRTRECQLNNSSNNDFIENFVQDDACLYIDNVLRPYSLPLEPVLHCKSRNDSKALGMRSGEIKDSQITGNKSHPNNEPYKGRLGSSTGWMTLVSSPNMFIQVSFEDARRVLTDVASQGSSVYQCWVTEYTIEYKVDRNSLDWGTYVDKSTNRPQIYQGNTDMNTVVKNAISQPFLATAVRLMPQAWNACIAMRIELYGCKEGSL
ncbi:EGF-like repeat and discoidin I-like domain-containing protein 3 [Actinia tenebrosa]|uniref:EGF-like repeat and discoidin I-like domain-containing protein 3 n=1 Tax=Actinia tenebrosa TaxID=6105 RepID=A0A6P8IW62_ACTTE|nr:EGF-like repeat and discoidin I-like domain-containing protein 3 [Actinia tenebrosa]